MSGGLPACIRETRTPLALTPAAPATEALMNGVFGLSLSNSVVIPARPAASPPDAHQVKISSCLSVAAFDAGADETASAIAAKTAATFDFFSM